MRHLAVAIGVLVAPAVWCADRGRGDVRADLERRTAHTVRETSGGARRAFALPPGVAVNGKLSAGDAVAIALWNNAALEADLAALGLAQADLADAGLLRNPSFQTLIPVGSKPFEFLLNWPLEDLWQRKKRVAAAERNLAVMSAGLVQNGLNLVRDVRTAHADLWLAENRGACLREAAALQERIARMTERRREHGDASGLEVSMAWAAARSAAEMAGRAEPEAEIVRARLRQLMGWREQTPFTAAAVSSTPPPAGATLLEDALSARPDLRAAELAIEAAAYRAKWQRSRVISLVVPLLSVKESGSPTQVRGGPGLQAEIPLFNRNQGQIARADAETVQAAWRYAALRDQVEGEVRQALARLAQARASLEQLRGAVKPPVEAAIAQTEAAYRNGDASYLNVLEATRQRFDLQLRELDAQAALARAQAELERSIGRTL